MIVLIETELNKTNKSCVKCNKRITKRHNICSYCKGYLECKSDTCNNCDKYFKEWMSRQVCLIEDD